MLFILQSFLCSRHLSVRELGSTSSVTWDKAHQNGAPPRQGSANPLHPQAMIAKVVQWTCCAASCWHAGDKVLIKAPRSESVHGSISIVTIDAMDGV